MIRVELRSTIYEYEVGQNVRFLIAKYQVGQAAGGFSIGNWQSQIGNFTSSFVNRTSYLGVTALLPPSLPAPHSPPDLRKSPERSLS